MYTYLGERNISSIDGLALAANEADAREKQFQYESEVLLKKFFAYDVFGNSMLSAESGEDAIEKLQNMISLSGKYINSKEIETWDGLNFSYDNIIQDGTYNVYRTYSQVKASQGLNPYLYFDTYDAALEALKAGINKETNVSTTTINIYVYLYTDKTGKNHTYSYTTDEEIANIIKEIMSLN